MRENYLNFVELYPEFVIETLGIFASGELHGLSNALGVISSALSDLRCSDYTDTEVVKSFEHSILLLGSTRELLKVFCMSSKNDSIIGEYRNIDLSQGAGFLVTDFGFLNPFLRYLDIVAPKKRKPKVCLQCCIGGFSRELRVEIDVSYQGNTFKEFISECKNHHLGLLIYSLAQLCLQKVGSKGDSEVRRGEGGTVFIFKLPLSESQE